MNLKDARTFPIFLKAHTRSTAAVSGLALIQPVIALLPFNFARYLFPPIGDFTLLAESGLVVFAVATLFVAYLLIGIRFLRTLILIFVVISLGAFIFYLSVASRFIRVIDIPAEHRIVLVSVGYEQTETAKRIEREKKDISNDWELIHAQGQREEDIQELWTAHSLQVTRLLLISTYFLAILSWVFAFSCVTSWDFTKTQVTVEGYSSQASSGILPKP